MALSKKKLFIFLLVCLPGFLSAGEVLTKTSQKVNFRVPYRPVDGKTSDYGSMILREMARDVLREPWLVNIRISGELGLQILKDGEKTRLLIFLNHPAIDGDTIFRAFPVAGVLFPSEISMRLRWANRADTSSFTEESIVKHISQADSLVSDLQVALFDPMVDTLMAGDIEFFYDSVAGKAFFDRIELIHDYYASVSLLDSLTLRSSGIRPGNHDMLPVNYIQVEELAGVLSRIEARDFPGTLLRNGYDPADLTMKYSQLYKNSRSLLYNFMDELHKSGVVLGNQNMDSLAAFFTSGILSYVRRSYLMDQQQGMIYRDCLDHFFDRSCFPPEENVMTSLLAKMFPDVSPDTIYSYVCRRIYASYRRTSQNLMEMNRFAEAFSMMENGRRFVSGNAALKGTEPDFSMQSRAAQGICDSYIGIASACIGSRKYAMAETYLDKAEHYAATHAEYIRSDTSYRRVFNELFFLRNSDCDQLLDQKKYTEALDCYRQFEKGYSARDLTFVSDKLEEKKSLARLGLGDLSAMRTEDALKRNEADTALYYYEKAKALRQGARTGGVAAIRLDSLAPVMARIKFEQISRDGEVALGKRQFTLSVNLLKEAKSLAEKNMIDRGRQFDSVYRQAMKNYLIVQLSGSQKKIWASQFDSAKHWLERTEAAGYDFGLLNDPDFVSATDRYKVKIEEQQCRNLRDSVGLRMIRADRNVAMGNYINATRYFNEASQFAVENPACGFDTRALEDSVERYRQPFEYQRNQNDVSTMITVGDYSGAITLLEKNEGLFATGNLSRFGLMKTALYEFIAERNNPHLAESAALFMLRQDQPREAFRFLTLLRNQGFDPQRVRKLQSGLGTALARADKKDHPDLLPETALRNYSSGEKWYDVFSKSYSDEIIRKDN
ncbi:MAG: hypothetical protein WCJ26_09585 [bacterium]